MTLYYVADIKHLISDMYKYFKHILKPVAIFLSLNKVKKIAIHMWLSCLYLVSVKVGFRGERSWLRVFASTYFVSNFFKSCWADNGLTLSSKRICSIDEPLPFDWKVESASATYPGKPLLLDRRSPSSTLKIENTLVLPMLFQLPEKAYFVKHIVLVADWAELKVCTGWNPRKKLQAQVEPTPSCNPLCPTRFQPIGFSLGSGPIWVDPNYNLVGRVCEFIHHVIISI